MKRSTSGFTIVELLVVIVVIAVLATLTVVAFNGVQNRAQTTAIKAELASAVKALESNKAASGSYPESLGATSVTSPLDRNKNIELQYTKTGDGDTSSFCVTAISGSQAYYVSSGNTGLVSSGVCAGHMGPAGPAEVFSAVVQLNPPGGTTTTYPLNIDFQPNDVLFVLTSKRYVGAATITVHGNTCNPTYTASLYTGATYVFACAMTGLSGTGNISASIASTAMNNTYITLIPMRGLRSNALSAQGAGWGSGYTQNKYTPSSMTANRRQIAVFAAVETAGNVPMFPQDSQPATGWTVAANGFDNDKHSAAYFIPTSPTTVSGSIQGTTQGYYAATMFVIGD